MKAPIDPIERDREESGGLLLSSRLPTTVALPSPVIAIQRHGSDGNCSPDVTEEARRFPTQGVESWPPWTGRVVAETCTT